jgi:hypothetical protein
MSVIQREVSIAANAVNENVIAGSAFEILRGNSIVSIGLTAQAAGLVGNIQIGSTVLVEESPLEIKANEFASIPDEMYYNGAGVGNDRVVIRVRNTTGGAVAVRVLVQITLV